MRAIAMLGGLMAASALMAACPAGGAPEGRALFEREGCIRCHVINGHGSGTVDLSGVRARRSDDWIRRQIRAPRSHRADTGMTAFPHLTDGDIEALIRYLGQPDG